jgi:hypothetical protein
VADMGTKSMRTKVTGMEGMGIEGMGTKDIGTEGSIGPGGCVCSSALGSWCRLGPTGSPTLTRLSLLNPLHGSMLNPRRHHPITGTIAMPRKPTTRMSNNAPEGGGRCCRHHQDRRI